MSLLNDANFLDQDLGSTNLAMLTFDSENSAIEFLSCTGSLKVVYTNEDGDLITETYSNLVRQKIQTATRSESPVYIIGSVTELKVADTLTAIDLRALRTLKYLDLNDQADLRSINLYGCRSLESLDLTGCSQIHVLDLYENKNLESLVLANCTGLLSINLSTNLHLHTVDLTGCTGIRYLDATMLAELQSLVVDGTQLESPDNTLILIQACYGDLRQNLGNLVEITKDNNPSLSAYTIAELLSMFQSGKVALYMGKPAYVTYADKTDYTWAEFAYLDCVAPGTEERQTDTSMHYKRITSSKSIIDSPGSPSERIAYAAEVQAALTAAQNALTEAQTAGRKVADLSEDIDEDRRQSDTLGDASAHSMDFHSPITICSEPLFLYGDGAPSANTIPANWDEEKMGRWVGMPSFIGQMYINTSASSNVLWIAVNNTATSGWKQA